MPSRKSDPLVQLRWALIVALSYLIVSGRPLGEMSPLEGGYVALLLATNLPLPWLLRRTASRIATRVVLATDSLLVLGGLFLLGAGSQDLFIGYFLCILVAALADTKERLAGGAFLASGVYALWLFQTSGTVERADLLLRLPFLFVTTIFYGYMLGRIREEERGRLAAEASVRGLDTLLRVTHSLSETLVTEDVLGRVAEAVRTTLGIDRCHIHLLGDDGQAIPEPHVVEALRSRSPVRHEGTTSIVALPIVHEREPLGVLLIEAERGRGPLGTQEVEFCQVIANASAPAIKNARQYERMVELERTRSEFLGSLSHEMRTPLHAILGYADLACEIVPRDDGSELATFVERISQKTMEMAEHVENLLQLSVSTLGRERRRLEPVDLPSLLSSALERVRSRARRDTIDFGLEVAPGIDRVYTDGDKLERVLRCLLANAVKFTEAGSIRIAAALVDSGADFVTRSRALPWQQLLSVSVRDTGIGIEEGELGRIFEEFRRADGSSTSRFGGLGLGLAVSRRMVETLGGTIRVESRPGTGSTFEILVPVQV